MSATACVTCQQPLILLIEPDEEDENLIRGQSSYNAETHVDDDVQLECGCHFHWQCLLDAYSVTLCPSCGKPLITTTSSGQEQLLCNLKNEGGLQERLDIMPILTEESYLKAYPEERKCRAYLEFCREGDVEAIVDLLRNAEEEEYENEEEAKQGRVVDVLRYRDQLGSMESGLHIAVQSQKLEVAWLLLFLGSSLEIDQFPEDVLQAAQTFGLQREDQSIKTDIRLLRDAEGNTAAQRAAIIGGFWDSWMITSILRPPEI